MKVWEPNGLLGLLWLALNFNTVLKAEKQCGAVAENDISTAILHGLESQSCCLLVVWSRANYLNGIYLCFLSCNDSVCSIELWGLMIWHLEVSSKIAIIFIVFRWHHRFSQHPWRKVALALSYRWGNWSLVRAPLPDIVLRIIDKTMARIQAWLF